MSLSVHKEMRRTTRFRKRDKKANTRKYRGGNNEKEEYKEQGEQERVLNVQNTQNVQNTKKIQMRADDLTADSFGQLGQIFLMSLGVGIVAVGAFFVTPKK